MTGRSAFRNAFSSLFDAQFPRLFRYLDRVSGDPELAQDVAQDAFLRLYRRGSMPDSPEAWLVSVAMNLFRNAATKHRRRRRLLSLSRAEGLQSDPAPTGEEATSPGRARRVRRALDSLSDRDRQLLLLHVEGYRYREIAAALDLNEPSVGTLLARARRAFRSAWEEASHAPQ